MDISVVIPTFNRAHTLLKTLDSVFDQSHPPREVIVVDDGSSDSTLSLLESYKHFIRIVRLESNRGVSYARNRGIKQSKAPWIAFLDSDDTWHRDKLLQQVEFHHNNPDLYISQTEETWRYLGKHKNKKHYHTKPHGDVFLPSLKRCLITPSSVMIHRSVFDSVGLFDESLLVCEDYDLWLRISRFYSVGLLNNALITKHGGHDDQLSRRYIAMDRMRIVALEKHLDYTRHQIAIFQVLLQKCKVIFMGAKRHNNGCLYSFYWNKYKNYSMLLPRLEHK
jgi:glycosyltransferase involved in cell wall biosynthesis